VLLPPFVRESREDSFVSCHRLASSALFLDSRARSVAINRETRRFGSVDVLVSVLARGIRAAGNGGFHLAPNGRLIPRARARARAASTPAIDSRHLTYLLPGRHHVTAHYEFITVTYGNALAHVVDSRITRGRDRSDGRRRARAYK